MRPNFALQTLQLGAAIGDMFVNLIQRVALLGELVFGRVNLSAGCLLRLAEARDFGWQLASSVSSDSSCLRE